MMTKNGILGHTAFTGKERDGEKEGSRGPFASERGDEPRSGIPNGSTYSYTYFGARYMDHEVMTMWLSVDPMADKYPSISPYAYCAWNPVKLVDPDGREILGEDGYHPVTPSEDDKIIFNKCVLNIIVGNTTVPQTSSIYPNSTDNIGAVFFSPTGKALTTMSMRSIERVVNNRHKARDKHWNQIIKRP